MARAPMYYIDVRHDGLNKFRRITGSDRDVVEEKANRQLAVWDELWDRKQDADEKRQAREDAAQEKEAKKELAVERTKEAQRAIAAIEAILAHTLRVDDTIDWGALKRRGVFPRSRPSQPLVTVPPDEPRPDEPQFRPDLGILDRLITPLRAKKEQAATARYVASRQQWIEQCGQVEAVNKATQESYRQECERWEIDNRVFEEEQAAHNRAVDERKVAYEAHSSDAIQDYCDLVLSDSTYPESFPAEYKLEYRSEGKILLVDYQLPDPDDLPRLREVRYVQSRDEMIESFISEAAFNKLYDNCLYQIALRTLHELFEADQIDAIGTVLFNGWVCSIDRATGKQVTACILSVQANRDEFMAFNLAQVDPRTCFRALKGVSSAKLHGLTPVQPILQLSTDDSRFVNARDVVDGLAEGDNLAAMDWEDFEHLIRELFEKEFAQSGGQVKITRASRDQGVDAVAFDPDPIRGGKIVIQAKRYTNTVGVSAVRDLYGTVMNEGAMKGILVSTSDYGPDAYDFVRGKPLTLLNGANLLHMLERHGHKARIDLNEAKSALVNR